MRYWHTLLLGLILCGFAAEADAATIDVMCSGGYTEALQELAPGFEKTTGDKVNIVLGPSMGTSAGAIPARLAHGQNGDLVIMVGYALKDLVGKGVVKPDSVTVLANSRIGLSVKHGAPKPDISTVAALKKTLLAAKSIAYSDSASGVYVGGELYRKLGLEKELAPKSHKIIAVRVATVVARGDAEIGFQQVSELLPVKGADFVGPIPEAVQYVTVFSAGIPAKAHNAALARMFLTYLTSPASVAVMEKTGLERPKETH